MRYANTKKNKTIAGLYQKKRLGGVEISRSLGVPIRQVYRILERLSVPRRPTHESNALRFWRTKPSFSIKKKFTEKDKLLWCAGLMLYWGEGAHYVQKTMLDFANSNPTMIRVYLKFLREICGIDETRVRIYLYCYANQDVAALKRFWSKTTGVSLKQFIQPYVREDFRKDKIGKMPYGLIHIRYADKKLYVQFEGWHQEILRKFGAGSEVAKRVTL